MKATVLPSGETAGTAPGAGFGDQLANGARRDVGHQQLRGLIVQIGFRAAVAFEHDGFAVGRPVHEHGAAQFAGARAPLAVGDLAGRAAIGRDDEQMRVPVFQESDLILPVVQRFHHARRARPLRAFRRGAAC